MNDKVNIFPIMTDVVIDKPADWKLGCLSLSERKRAEKNKYSGYGRCIGGDQGDVLFNGYDIIDGKTYLVDPALITSLDWNPTNQDVYELAMLIINESMASIGIETVAHS